jgi:DNA-directed RNA polymerase specialized sigma24 family protein
MISTLESTHAPARSLLSRYRAAQHRPATRQLFDDGPPYREAARSLGTGEATLTTRLHCGRQHVACQLANETASAC